MFKFITTIIMKLTLGGGGGTEGAGIVSKLTFLSDTLDGKEIIKISLLCTVDQRRCYHLRNKDIWIFFHLGADAGFSGVGAADDGFDSPVERGNFGKIDSWVVMVMIITELQKVI